MPKLCSAFTRVMLLDVIPNEVVLQMPYDTVCSAKGRKQKEEKIGFHELTKRLKMAYQFDWGQECRTH